MTSLPPPEQWVLSKMSEMEVAEMIEQHIDYYTEDKDGNRRSVHLPTPFVRHFMRRHDGVLPTVVAIATAPIVLADGGLLAPDGLDRDRGIQFIIQDELRAVIPQRQDCTPERVKAAMEFLCDEWLVDVATDYIRQGDNHCRRAHPDRALAVAGPAVLLRHRRAARWGKNNDPHHADHGRHRTAAGSGGVVDQRGGAPQGTDELLPLRSRLTSCGTTSRAARRSRARTSRSPAPPRTIPTASSASAKWSAPPLQPSTSSPATISGRGATWLRAASTSASTSIASTPRTGRSSTRTRSAGRRTTAPRSWRRSTPSCWAIPQLKAARDAEGKTRFKMWWRLVGSAVENAAKLAGQELDFQKLFLTQEEDDEESASLADVLEVLVKKWPDQFMAADVAGMINNPSPNEDEQTLREYLLPGALPNHVFSAKSIGRRLKQHLDEPVRSGERTLVLRSWEDKHVKLRVYGVHTITTT